LSEESREKEWDIFEDPRYDADKQVCVQCDKFDPGRSRDGLGACSFLGEPISAHQLEWAVALSDAKCNGFEFKDGE